MKYRKFIVVVLILQSLFAQADNVKPFIAASDVFFKKYVSNGGVTYSKIKQNIGEIGILYKQIGEAKLDGLDDNSKKAFYINAYNIIVIYWVAKHYPLKSPLDDSGFFDKVRHTVAGEELTLNVLEIKKLLLPYKDARFHFALACAAKSCPPLPSFAFQPDKLEQQLTERTTLALNNKGWIKVYEDKKKIELSKIFDWYKGDFAADGKTLIDWINQFRKEKIPTTYTVGFYEYNWALNDR